MSLALDFLAEYFSQPQTTKADFAKAAGFDPSLVSAILKEDVLVSSKNLPKLLRGFRTDEERRDFLAAYLRDQVPADFADDIHIQLAHLPEAGMVMESGTDEAARMDGDLVAAFRDLPSNTYRRRVLRFLRQLRRDADLRELFVRTMDYIDEGVTRAAPDAVQSALEPGRPSASGAAANPSPRK